MANHNRNRQLDAMIDQMVQRHCEFIHGYGTLLRQAYQLGRSDERNGIYFDDEPPPKTLGDGTNPPPRD